MENGKRLLDYQKAKEIVLDILKGKITTVTAVTLVTMLKGATVEAVEVVHGHKVVQERHRGVARYIPCPCCSSAIPSNKPYTEKVEYCSVCGKKLDDTFQNYCPNCGAKMDGGNEDG